MFICHSNDPLLTISDLFHPLSPSLFPFFLSVLSPSLISFLHILLLMLICRSSFYIPDTNTLSVIPVACVFTFKNNAFWCTEFKNSTQFNLSILFFHCKFELFVWVLCLRKSSLALVHKYIQLHVLDTRFEVCAFHALVVNSSVINFACMIRGKDPFFSL